MRRAWEDYTMTVSDLQWLFGTAIGVVFSIAGIAVAALRADDTLKEMRDNQKAIIRSLAALEAKRGGTR